VTDGSVVAKVSGSITSGIVGSMSVDEPCSGSSIMTSESELFAVAEVAVAVAFEAFLKQSCRVACVSGLQLMPLDAGHFFTWPMK